MTKISMLIMMAMREEFIQKMLLVVSYYKDFDDYDDDHNHSDGMIYNDEGDHIRRRNDDTPVGNLGHC